jgi:hypothetical protein
MVTTVTGIYGPSRRFKNIQNLQDLGNEFCAAWSGRAVQSAGFLAVSFSAVLAIDDMPRWKGRNS